MFLQPFYARTPFSGRWAIGCSVYPDTYDNESSIGIGKGHHFFRDTIRNAPLIAINFFIVET